jgi:hypothetical protein
MTKLMAVVAALAALALGGSALASAARNATPPAAQTQSIPTAPDTDNVQQGDQTGSDQADAAGEQTSTETGPSDGPGGYADTSSSADTQQLGEH